MNHRQQAQKRPTLSISKVGFYNRLVEAVAKHSNRGGGAD